jgi:hypothetical protein
VDQLKQIRGTVGMVLGYVGIALVTIALAKFFGVSIPMRGSVTDTAMVGMACCLAR